MVKKRQKILNSIKKAIIREKLMTDKTDAKIAEEFNVERSTVTKIFQRKDKYLNLADEEATCKKSRIQLGYFSLVEEALYKWYLAAKSANIPISYQILKEKALSFHVTLKEKNAEIRDNFEASNGWLINFLNRYNLASKVMNGESESVDQRVIDDFIEKIRPILENYEPEDIYNCDEAGLFFRVAPNRTIVSKSEKCKGYKRDKVRITILFAVNASGEKKVMPLVIGKSANPRCFKHVKRLPVRYTSNSCAWMTGEKWLEWIKWFDSTLTKDSILLVDNCPAHVNSNDVKLNHLKLMYLPRNTTSKIQPLDAGIIKAFKLNYRKLLVKFWIRMFESKCEIKPIDLKQSIDFIDESWNSISQETIKNCWRHTGLLPDSLIKKLNFEDQSITKNCCDLELDNLLTDLKKFNNDVDMNSEEYVNSDEACATFYVPDEHEIVNEVLTLGSVEIGQRVADVDDENEDEERVYVTKDVGYDSFVKLLSYLEQFEAVKSEDLRFIKDVFKKIEIEELKKLKQPTIFDILRLNK